MPPKPEFHLHLGAGGPYYFFREGVLRRIPQQGNLSFDFVYLLPVKRAVRFAKEHLIDRSPAGALADPPVFTFYEYMLHLYRRLPDPRKVISPAMRLFLVEEVLQQSLDKLRFFSPTSAGRRGLIRKVDGLLTELREYGYDGDKLLSQIAESESDNRLHDFSLLIDAFNQLLGDQLIDEAGAIQEVVNRLDEAFFRKYMAGVEVIYLNGYGLFSRPMITFFEKIRSFCQVHIQLDYDPTNPDLFQHIALAYEDLMALGPEEVVSHQFQQAGGGWIPRLFSTAGEQAPPVDPGKDILIQPATSRAEEVAFMANYVKRLHRVEGIPLHRIGITFPSLERYAALIRDIFPRHGLPFNLSTGLALNQSPLVRSFLLALEVPLSGFESGRLLQLVSSPFFRPQAYMQVSAPDLKALCRELRITHFSGKWRDHLREQVAYLSRLREEMAGEDELALRDIDLRLNRLQTLEKPLASLLNPFRELARPHGAAAFRDAFLSILRKLNFLDWYKGPVSQLGPQEQEQEFRSFNRFIKLLDQFSWIVTRRHGERSLELNELYQFLKLLVDQATYNLREWDQFGVQVMPRLEILAIEPEVLLFGGMVEGDFPRPFNQDVFFHDEEREELGLAATEDLLGQDRYVFYQVLNARCSRLVFTFPRFQREAARVPSNFLSVLEDHCQVRWRKRLPGQRFLENPRHLLESVAARLPMPVRTWDQRRLQTWYELSRQTPRRIESAGFWLHRVESGLGKRGISRFGRHEGMLALEASALKRLSGELQEGRKPFSITRLEAYGFCPIRYYFLYHLKIREEEELETGLTPLDRGNYVHNTLFRFFSECRELGEGHLPWHHPQRLMDIAREEFERLPYQGLLFELEKELYFGSEGRAGVWERFLEVEASEYARNPLQPAFFEAAFGPGGLKRDRDPVLSVDQALPISDGRRQANIIGKIDRVDLGPAGQAALIDYKTGLNFARAQDVWMGLSLQLPVYAALLPALLERAGLPRAEAVVTAIAQVRDPENCERVPLIFDREAVSGYSARLAGALPNNRWVDGLGNPVDFGEMVNLGVRWALDYVQGIREGRFHHTRYPEETFCQRHCEFRRLCRKDEQKLLSHPWRETAKGR